MWLLPIVACEVAAASGGLLAPHLAATDGYGVLITSYVLWALSVPLAMNILAILLLRLVVHNLPGQDMAASSWLSLGPIGTGALGLLLLGGDAPELFAAAGLPMVGQVANGAGIIGGLVLWGYGVWWLVLAVMKTAHYLRRGMPFNLGWWGFTFPLGVYSLATLALGRATHLSFFTVAGGVLVLCLTGSWAVVASRTAREALSGALFVSPCGRAADWAASPVDRNMCQMTLAGGRMTSDRYHQRMSLPAIACPRNHFRYNSLQCDI